MVLYNAFPSSAYTIGGKARGLVLLREAGMDVPDFLIIPAENFDPLLNGGMQDAETIQRCLLNYSLPKNDKQRIAAILDQWGCPGRTVIVRSSIADEDGEQHSFAGIMDSFPDLASAEHVFGAVARCAASAYSSRALAYRRQKGLPKARPAVIVQQQILPDAAGVLFSTFPEYPQEMAVHAVWGSGEGLVGGALEADEFYLLKSTGRVHRQKLAASSRESKAGKNVPPQGQPAPCLQENHLHQLYRSAQHLEKTLAHPQDMEFLVKDDRIYFVQTRPITQPIPEVIVYDNSNIQESYCGVTTPLTFSFAQRAYATVYKQTMQVLALPEKVIRAHEGVVNNLLGLVKGRIYYHINNWYRGLQLLPSFRQNKEDMERMMGVEEPVDFVEDTRKTFIEKCRLLPGLAVNLLRLVWAFSRLHKRVPAFHRHFQEHYDRFYARHPEDMDIPALLEQKAQLDSRLLQNWTTPIINDFYVMMTNGRVVRNLHRAGIADAEEFLSRYLSGDQQIESARPARALEALARKARNEKELQQLVVALPYDVHEQVKKLHPSFYNEVRDFIGLYGDRTVGELKLETITMRLSPRIFYTYLRNYLLMDEGLHIEASAHLHREAAVELRQKLENRPAFFKKSLFGQLDRLQQAIRYRESLRLQRTRLFGMYRTLYIALGRKLFGDGILPSARDIFYLSESEIEELARGQKVEHAAALAGERKMEFELYKQEEVPARLVVPSPPVPTAAPVPEASDKLQGTGCFAGIVTAEVVVVSSPETDLDVTGRIVCALRTDPGWVALFPTCKGVLIEKGSALSHSVILLREFGIPAIINIPYVTKRLASGQLVTMDGSTGIIKIHD